MASDFMERVGLCARGYASDGIPMSEFFDANLRPIVERGVNLLLESGFAPAWLDAETHTITVLCSWARGMSVHETWPVDATQLGGVFGRAIGLACRCFDDGELSSAMVRDACIAYLGITSLDERSVGSLADFLAELVGVVWEAYR